MIQAILIGFEYTSWYHGPKLPGCLVDLFLMYSYLMHLQQVQVHLITDIRIDDTYIQDAIAKEVITPEIYDFLQVPRHTVTSPEDLTSHFFLEAEQVLLYYSGHATPEGLQCPNKDYYLWDSLITLLKGRSQQLFLILDCCHPSSLQLPFKLTDRLRLQPNRSYYANEIILVTSSTTEHVARSTKYGSLFTRHLLITLSRLRGLTANLTETLQIRNRDLLHFKQDLQTGMYAYYQEIQIYSSYNFQALFPWVLGATLVVTVIPELSYRVLS